MFISQRLWLWLKDCAGGERSIHLRRNGNFLTQMGVFLNLRDKEWGAEDGESQLTQYARGALEWRKEDRAGVSCRPAVTSRDNHSCWGQVCCFPTFAHSPGLPTSRDTVPFLPQRALLPSALCKNQHFPTLQERDYEKKKL